MKHPIQPTEEIEGVVRFKENKIVSWLLDCSGMDMNDIACQNFSNEDRQQFAQLIGYSVSGYAGLSYADDYSFNVAVMMSDEGLSEKDARIKYLEGLVSKMKKSLLEIVPELFGIHPDDLGFVE